MAFKQLNKDVLSQVAEEFAVEWTTEDPTKEQMIKDLEEEGVTWKMYKAAFPDPTDEPEPEEVQEPEPEDADDDIEEEEQPQASRRFTRSSEVLVKMTRENGTYEVRGYKFTRSHPFLVVKSADADFLVEELGGFKIASPREAEEYYS